AIEYQATDEVSVGLALAGGTGLADETDFGSDDDTPPRRMWLFSGRLFGQWNARDARWAATTFGLGVGRLSSGLTYLTLDAGEAIGYQNETLIPHMAVELALSIPLARGEPFGAEPRTPKTELWRGVLGGLVVPIGHGNELAVEASGLS